MRQTLLGLQYLHSEKVSEGGGGERERERETERQRDRETERQRDRETERDRERERERERERRWRKGGSKEILFTSLYISTFFFICYGIIF